MKPEATARSRRPQAVEARRRVLQAGGAWVLAWAVRPAAATPDAMAEAMRGVVGSRAVQEGRVRLELPRIADDGNVVSMTVKVDSPMSGEDHVRVIHVFSEQNPMPVIAQFHLGPHYPRPEVATRIRLAKSQRVTALAEMSDGSLWSATVQVEVTITACGD